MIESEPEELRVTIPADDKRIIEAVRKTMTDQFKSVKVRNITVKPETDQFGSDVLHIDVIHDGKSLNPKGVAGFVRHLRPRLFQLQERKFPVVYFVSSAEQKISTAGEK